MASVKTPPLPLFLRCHHAANRAFPGVLATSPFLVLFQLRPLRPVLRIAVTSRPSPELRPFGGPRNCDPGWRVREGMGRRGPATVPPNIHYRCRLRDLQAAAARCQESSRRLPAGAFLPIELRVSGRQWLNHPRSSRRGHQKLQPENKNRNLLPKDFISAPSCSNTATDNNNKSST